MKKIFAFAIAAVTMTVGCQKIQELIRPGNGPVDDDSPVEIQFTTNVATVETKGSGSIDNQTGGAGDLNTLANKKVYIYGFNNSKPGEQELDNVEATVGTETDGKYPLDLGSNPYFYNGVTDTYDFYGYYVEDAVTGTPAPDENYQLDVTIDGTQDILLAEADMNITVPDGATWTAEDLFSAKTARAGVVPNLVFEHALARYYFDIQNKGSYTMNLESLSISSLTNGKLTVASKTEKNDVEGEPDIVIAQQGLKATTGDNANLFLELPEGGVKLWGTNDSEETGYSPDAVSLAGEIMTFAKYDAAGTQDAAVTAANQVTVVLTQGGMTGKKRVITMPLNVETELGTDGQSNIKNGTVAGYQYKVSIIVYSLEEVHITATVAPWKDGANLELNPDQETGEEWGDDKVIDVSAKVEEKPETATSEKLTFVINVSKYVESFKHVLKPSDNTDPIDWTATDVSTKEVETGDDGKMKTEYEVEYAELTAETEYTLHVLPIGEFFEGAEETATATTAAAGAVVDPDITEP